MSYDIYLSIDTGGKEPAIVSDYKTPTYNLGPMFKLALGTPLATLRGKTGKECIAIISPAVYAIITNPEPFKELNPANGWGKYEDAVSTLEWMLEECRLHPKAIMNI